MRSGQVLTILGRSEDELWFRVITSNRTEGWVPVSVVEAAGNVGGLGVIPGPSNTPTNTPTVTPTPTWTVSPTTTLTSTVTYTPSPDVTATLSMATRIAVQQTRTAAACVWNYALVEQSPAGGEDNPVPANTSYRREITLQNTGNCAWEALTALVFMPNSGESFGAGPRIFIRERVEVGQTIVLVFEGLTPAKGALYQGRWELKTPGQVIIGDPLIISVRVFEQG